MFDCIKNFLALFIGRPRSAHASQETIRLLLERRSCRRFSGREVTDREMETILEAGRYAPSTVNLQTWSFIAFTKQQWREVFDRPLPFNAERSVIICADTAKLQGLLPDLRDTPCLNLSFAVFNAGLAAQNMTVAAEALGLGSVMLSETGRTGLLDYDCLRQTLELPDGVLPVTTLVIGRPAKKMPGIPPRQPLAAVVMEKRYDPAAAEKLADWFRQMLIGYKLTNPLSGFDRQLAVYKRKMHESEKSIRQLFLR